jgi:hypothetical protein
MFENLSQLVPTIWARMIYVSRPFRTLPFWGLGIGFRPCNILLYDQQGTHTDTHNYLLSPMSPIVTWEIEIIGACIDTVDW